MAVKTLPIGNYVSITEILRLVAEHGGDPDSAEINASAYKDYDSYGDSHASAELELTFTVK